MNSSDRSSLDLTFLMLRRLTDEAFWGTVTLKFKSGALVHITTEESLLPDQLPSYLELKDQNHERTRLDCSSPVSQ